jgi:hypothetical protein
MADKRASGDRIEGRHAHPADPFHRMQTSMIAAEFRRQDLRIPNDVIGCAWLTQIKRVTMATQADHSFAQYKNEQNDLTRHHAILDKRGCWPVVIAAPPPCTPKL